MDQALHDLAAGPNDPAAKPGSTVTTQFVLLNDPAGVVEVPTSDGPKRHALKPLAELYASGGGGGTVDPLDTHYMALFLCIEEAILHHSRSNPHLSDAGVLLTLERLAMNPETDPGPDTLARDLQLQLRLLLSLQDYVRQDVRAALRKIAKSVARHTKLAGPHGYLDFIEETLPG